VLGDKRFLERHEIKKKIHKKAKYLIHSNQSLNERGFHKIYIELDTPDVITLK
jgi:hypothetical protein